MGRARHFTVTGFVVQDGATLLHWHRKVGLWLPPGGHVEPNEDPVEAVLREIMEETGMTVEIVPTAPAFGYDDPPQLPPPATIMVEPIRAFGGDDAHHHIDSIYFTRPLGDSARVAPPAGWRWLQRAQLERDEPIVVDGESRRVSEDVRILGMAAIDHVARVADALESGGAL